MRFIDRATVEAALDLDQLVEAMATAMADLSLGKASVPPRVAAFVEKHAGLLGTMSAYVPSLGVLAAKLVSLYPNNAGGPLPTHQAVIACFDPANGRPLAIMDGTYITAMRTAAASALATRLLSRQESRVLAILGTGVQARAHGLMVPRVRNLSGIVVSGRDTDKAAALATELSSLTGV